MIEQIGNYVKINERMIPAGNIQVEGYPKYVTHSDGSEVWYGIYFEIAFEDGSLWIVDQWSDPMVQIESDEICVATYNSFALDRRDDDIPDYAWLLDSWDMFLVLYKDKLENLGRGYEVA